MVVGAPHLLLIVGLAALAMLDVSFKVLRNGNIISI